MRTENEIDKDTTMRTAKETDTHADGELIEAYASAIPLVKARAVLSTQKFSRMPCLRLVQIPPK